MAAARLAVYLLLFMLFRDALSLSGLWSVGGGYFLWMRFAQNVPSLLLLGAFSALFVLGLFHWERELARGVRWIRGSAARAVGLGLLGGAIVAGPALVAGFFVSSWGRGGPVPVSLWPAIAWLSFAGNLLEETLFRGFLQARLASALGEGRALLGSALAFATAHAALAAQIGGWTGLSLVAFTFYEGLICAWLSRRHGLLAAALAHGLGIFLLSTGLP
ncbi:MAG TPA: CPBP family glutamic-type intramembrane protease [Bdellovibrionota bacterium]|nr:CPBP family glutamic-type intramembrane protease [Bdellovibrionota bacterium]